MQAWRGHFPLCPFKRGTAVAEVSFHNNNIRTFMVYEDRLYTAIRFIQLLEHPENSE